MMRLDHLACACAAVAVLAACGDTEDDPSLDDGLGDDGVGDDGLGDDSDDDSGDMDPDNAPPDFLLQGWIWPLDYNVARTYDFTQVQAAGVRSVEIRAWQAIGTLGWQSNQLFSAATFVATPQEISITSATGYQENWIIVGGQDTTMVVEDPGSGARYYWYNCAAQGWPPVILASMRGCQ
jgi:hypothetical protein